MKTKQIAFYLYFIACVAAITAVILDNELLLLIAKPIIIPSIFYYYLTKTKRLNFLFSVVLLLSFIGDTIMLLKIKSPLWIMAPYGLSYLILIRFLIVDLLRTQFNLRNFLFSAGVLGGHGLMLYLLLDLQTLDGQQLIMPFTVYGIVLSIMVTLSVYNYLADKSISGFYLLIGCCCSLVSDVFYVMYNEHFHIPILNYINSAMQLFTYFFLVKYIIHRKDPVLKIAV